MLALTDIGHAKCNRVTMVVYLTMLLLFLLMPFGAVGNIPQRQPEFQDQQHPPRFGGFGSPFLKTAKKHSDYSADDGHSDSRVLPAGTFSSSILHRQHGHVAEREPSASEHASTPRNSFQATASEFITIENEINTIPKRLPKPLAGVSEPIIRKKPAADAGKSKETEENMSMSLLGPEMLVLLLVLAIPTIWSSNNTKRNSYLETKETMSMNSSVDMDAGTMADLQAQRTRFVQDTLRSSEHTRAQKSSDVNGRSSTTGAEVSTSTDQDASAPDSAIENEQIDDCGGYDFIDDENWLEWDPCLQWCCDVRELSRLEELVENHIEDEDATTVEQMLTESVLKLSSERQAVLGPLVAAVAVDQQSMETCTAALACATEHVDYSPTNRITGTLDDPGDVMDELLQQYVVLGSDEEDSEGERKEKMARETNTSHDACFVAVSRNDCVDTSGGDSAIGANCDCSSDIGSNDYVSDVDTADGADRGSLSNVIGNRHEGSRMVFADSQRRVEHTDDDTDVALIRTLIKNSIKNQAVDETELCTVALNVVEAQKRQTIEEQAKVSEVCSQLRHAWEQEMETAHHQRALVQQQCDRHRQHLLRELQTTKATLLRQIHRAEDGATESLIAEFKSRKEELDHEHAQIFSTAARMIVVSWLVVSAAMLFDTAVGTSGSEVAGAQTLSLGYILRTLRQLGRLFQFGMLFLIQGVLGRLGLWYPGTALSVFLAARYICWDHIGCLLPGSLYTMIALMVSWGWYNVFVAKVTAQQLDSALQRLATLRTDVDRPEEDIQGAFAWVLPMRGWQSIDARTLVNHAVVPWAVAIASMNGLGSIASQCAAE